VFATNKHKASANRYATIIIIAFSVLTIDVFAQSIEIRQIEFLNNQVLIRYDLIDSISGRSYSIRLFTSADDFLNSSQKATGDVGLEIKPGSNKTIQWQANEELGTSFDGKVTIELRARLFVPFIDTENIDQFKIYRRKRDYNLTWSGGTPQNILNFDLMRGDKKVMSFPNIANVGHHTLQFPVYVHPARDYRFRISDSKNRDEQVYSSTFRIRRKIPLLLKAVPVVAVGVLLALLLKISSEPDIVDPILPPTSVL
jgi:hypothetical protein